MTDTETSTLEREWSPKKNGGYSTEVTGGEDLDDRTSRADEDGGRGEYKERPVRIGNTTKKLQLVEEKKKKKKGVNWS